MYLENGDEVIEASNGRLILANSGAYCDEKGNPTGGCIDDESAEETLDNQPVYITEKGKTYHKSPNCPSLKGKTYREIPASKIGDRRPCKRCFK